MSTDHAQPDGTPMPVSRLVAVLVVLGLAGMATAGGTVTLAARIQESATGFEVDGLSLLLPGLGVTAVTTFLAAATTARIVRGARHVSADALARHASARAPVPLAVTAALVLLLCAHRVPGGLAEVAARRPGLATGRRGSAPSASRAQRSSAPPARCRTSSRRHCRAARSCCAPPCCSGRPGTRDPVS
jgi:hypothetical protein